MARSILAAFAAALLVTAATVAAATPQPGSSTTSPPLLVLTGAYLCEYVTPGGLRQVEMITGNTMVLGRLVWVKEYSVGPDAGLRNWWLLGPTGDVQLAGFDSPALGLSLAYDPPITLCGGDPLAGDLWTTHVTAYELPAMSVYAVMDLTYGLLEQGPLALPIGPTPAFGVGQTAALPLAAATPARCTLDGRRLPDTAQAASAASAATDWFSPGIGLVQYQTIDLFQLRSYGIVLPVKATTWGALKAARR
jgi:hypothetical protein